ncbi:hypothetical protein AAL_04528 [Moelleriella libera RCEF 2490]|uniref:Stress activated map kinase interacting n=1 Tax=Moelleriella libera RCEF 2490 TaxID=1081109 RepID=A0A168BH39_9HYPO|nr:hypothetical protein AAL_04528 [Moelleriella libera RCEF 2490]
MALVDYASDSASDAEAATPPPKEAKPAHTTAKKPFQKVVDRANPRKIIVSLPSPAAASSDGPQEPPAKRPRTTGGGLFSGFNSFLPPPKNTRTSAAATSAAGTALPRPGVHLKTSAAPGFSRDTDDCDDDDKRDAVTSASSLPRQQEPAPSIPEGQKPADEVKLVGKPLLFRPLSVAANTKKKKKAQPSSTGPAKSQAAGSLPSKAAGVPAAVEPPRQQQQPRPSLFSLHTEVEEPDHPPASVHGAYEPLFETAYPADTGVGQEQSVSYTEPVPSAAATDSLDHMADDMGLSAAARRELFGRNGSNFAAKKVVNFNLDKEYEHNEALRAAGDQQAHNPVRAIQGGGKHSLKQLVQNVQNQKEALEESFAKGRSNRKEASSRYGW